MTGFQSRYPALPTMPKDYSASSGTTVTTGTSAIPGLSHSFTSVPGATYIVIVTADVSINTAGTVNIVEAVFDGVALTPGCNIGGASGQRVTGCQTYFVFGDGAAHTVTVQTRNAAGGSATVNGTHTRMVFFRLS